MKLFVFQSNGNAPKVYTTAVKAYDRARIFVDDESRKAVALSPTGKASDEFLGQFDIEGFQTLSDYDLDRLIDKSGERYLKLYTVKRSSRISGAETEVASVWATTCKFSGETIEEAF